MEDKQLERYLLIARQVIGGVLVLTSIPLLYKGTAGSGEVGLDISNISWNLKTTSAGFAQLVAGVLLLLYRPQSSTRRARRNVSELIIGICFYLFVGLLPVLAFVGLTIYIETTQKDAWLIPSLGMFALYIEVPLLFWVVGQVAALLRSSAEGASE